MKQDTGSVRRRVSPSVMARWRREEPWGTTALLSQFRPGTPFLGVSAFSSVGGLMRPISKVKEQRLASVRLLVKGRIAGR